jgi:hypothetical protein
MQVLASSRSEAPPEIEDTDPEAPSRRRARRAALVFCGLALVPTPSIAEAQAVTEYISPQLALARVCASEIGLTGSPEECAAIHSVIRRRADRMGWSFIWAIRAYSTRVFDRERSDPRQWVAHLRADGRQPAGWPTSITVRRRGEARVVRHAPWGAYRERWLTLYRAAGQIVRGEIHPQCQRPVDHWGMRHGVDFERAQRAGWDEVDCGETRNAFWAVPAVAQAEARAAERQAQAEAEAQALAAREAGSEAALEGAAGPEGGLPGPSPDTAADGLPEPSPDTAADARPEAPPPATGPRPAAPAEPEVEAAAETDGAAG